MSSVAAVLALCRFGQDAAALMLWGASAYLAWLVPKDIVAEVVARIGRWGAVAVIVVVVAVAAKLPAEVASIGEGWRDGFDPAMIVSVLKETSVGQAWTAQAVTVSLLASVQAAPRRMRLGATALASCLVLSSLALGGHAVMHEGLIGVMHRANDVLHVLSAGAWLGSLLPVLVILNFMGRSEWRADAGLALRSFSRAGHVAVALVLISGVVNAALVLGRWPTDLSSPYQALLDAKVLSIAAMGGLALVNRYLFVPRLSHQPEALTALRRATLAEMPLGLAAIALVAVFGMLDPT
jgi:putative copper resistance protein D